MSLFSRRETTEERYQRTSVEPQQAAQSARTAGQVREATHKSWRDRGTPEEKARIGYDATHPKHPRNRR